MFREQEFRKILCIMYYAYLEKVKRKETINGDKYY